MPPIDNDDSDIIVKPTDVPQDASEAVVTSTPLDEVVDYDETSVQSMQDNELVPTTSTADPSQTYSEEAEVLQPAESLKRRKIDMGQLMVKTNVTKRASQRSVTKRGSLGEDENLSSTKTPIDNDESDIIVEPTDVLQDASEAVVTSTHLMK